MATTINYSETPDYVIRLNSGIYLKEHPSGLHWTMSIYEAKKFMFMTSAIVYATHKLDMSPVEYTVETLEAKVTV